MGAFEGGALSGSRRQPFTPLLLYPCRRGSPEGDGARARGRQDARRKRDPLDFPSLPALRWHLNQDHPAKGKGDAENRVLRGAPLLPGPAPGGGLTRRPNTPAQYGHWITAMRDSGLEGLTGRESGHDRPPASVLARHIAA